MAAATKPRLSATLSECRQTLAQRIDAALPQTQCTRCGYPDCAAYAQAVATGQAQINQCPPGGAQGIARLAAITGQRPAALNPANGIEAPRRLALIDEASCIGCTLCIDACPTAAIIGCAKHMHSVIESRCTGCELCVPVCPVDCISMENASGERTGWEAWSPEQADAARRNYRQRVLRLARAAGSSAATAAKPAREAEAAAAHPADRKRSTVEAALARARERARAGSPAG